MRKKQSHFHFVKDPCHSCVYYKTVIMLLWYKPKTCDILVLDWFQMFAPARKAATSCSLRSLLASPLSSFSPTAYTAFPLSASSYSIKASPVPCKFIYSLNSSTFSPHPNSTHHPLSSSVRRMGSAAAPEEREGEEEETKAEKKRAAQLAQVLIPLSL